MNIFAGIGGGIVLGVLILLAVSSIGSCMDRKELAWQKMVADCEAKGGVILDRTYSYGKGQTGHNYTCIDKAVIK